MSATRLLSPALGLGLGALLLLPATRGRAYSVIGGSLALTQRDFRVFDNFSGAAANDNQTPDANFPGYQGAALAIWKASVEWGSLPHGDGGGDPSQSELGSGGANFDASFQGLATQVGGPNDNIHSQISGANGGVLAYCEAPISDGWRIRYYQAWDWADGPATIGSGQVDLQGVACHEYGHALGLGHSASASATMSPSISQGALGPRSIASDDRAGVQAVYGVLDPQKPVITGVSISAGQLTVTGANFDPVNNEVWFTQAGAGGNGNPVKVAGVVSNGAQLSVHLPVGSGPGDVLVRRNAGGHAALSNAWPSDLQESGPACGPPTGYCTSGPNSSGQAATIGASGSTSLAANDLALHVVGAPTQRTGLFYWGTQAAAQPFGNGVRCVGGAVVRLPLLQTDGSGRADQPLDLGAALFAGGPAAAQPGAVLRFQFWFRDPAAGGAGFDLSDGLEVLLCP